MKILLLVVVVVGTVLTAVGCGGNPVDKMLAEANSNNQKRLANLYAMFRAENGFRGPEDEAEFKAFIAEKLKDDIQKERLRVTGSVDDLFINERDGKAFKIRYGVPGGARGGKPLPIIFEDEGEGGVRIVCFSSANMEEVTDSARYDELWNMEDSGEGPGRNVKIPGGSN